MKGLRESFLGSALGTAVGDALGRAVEGWSRDLIRLRFGLLEEVIDGRYTDDTEMMIGLMEALLDDPEFDPQEAARRFLENFNPFRGYGARIFAVMERLRQGLPWDQVGTDSWGNGAAMRVAPIGFFFHHDLEKLKEKAILSALITHKHPDGVAGAVAQAMAVGIATGWARDSKEVDREEMLGRIVDAISDLSPGFALEIERLRELPERMDPLRGSDFLARTFPCDISAKGAVPAAISAFLVSESFEEAVIMAVNAGGDTDTLGAMTGAIAGAYYGFGAIPQRWLERLEEGPKGKSYIMKLAERLCMLRER